MNISSPISICSFFSPSFSIHVSVPDSCTGYFVILVIFFNMVGYLLKNGGGGNAGAGVHSIQVCGLEYTFSRCIFFAQ